jgi:hypothetical protein
MLAQAVLFKAVLRRKELPRGLARLSALVDCQIDANNGVARLIMSNPPVNSLSLEM